MTPGKSEKRGGRAPETGLAVDTMRQTRTGEREMSAMTTQSLSEPTPGRAEKDRESRAKRQRKKTTDQAAGIGKAAESARAQGIKRESRDDARRAGCGPVIKRGEAAKA